MAARSALKRRAIAHECGPVARKHRAHPGLAGSQGRARSCVRLRNGSEPKETWAAQTTRWTLTTGPASAFDVIAYRAEAE